MTVDPQPGIAGSDLYYASLYRPPGERERVRLLDAIVREIAAIPLAVSDRGVARVKLDWWHTEAAALLDQQPRHELTRAYHQRFGSDRDIAPPLHALVTGLDRELGGERLTTRAAQISWFDETFGPVYRLYAPAPEPAVTVDETALVELARWIEMAYALLRIKALALRQLQRFPSDVLDGAGCNPNDFITGANAGAVVRFVTAESNYIGDALDSCRAQLPDALRTRARTLSTLATIVGRTLVEMRDDGCRVWQHQVTLTPLRKLWCAFRGRWV